MFKLQTLCSIYCKTCYFHVIASQTLCSITNPMFIYKPYVQLQTLCSNTNPTFNCKPYVQQQTLCSIYSKTRILCVFPACSYVSLCIFHALPCVFPTSLLHIIVCFHAFSLRILCVFILLYSNVIFAYLMY